MTGDNKWVLSFGGSLLFDGQSLDLAFLRDTRSLIAERVAVGDTFIIVVGGGNISRHYQEALRSFGHNDIDLDWIGIHACRFNAQLMRLLLKEWAHPELILDVADLQKVTLPVVFAGGIAPGGSSDFVSVQLAQAAGSKKIVNMTNTSHVFDKDPAKFPDALAFETLTWEQFRALMPEKWTPGLHAPFDPHAAAVAQQGGIEVTIIGKDIQNLRKLLEGEKFVGTTLHL